MAAISVFRPLVYIDCPGVPNPMMDDAIRRAAREFCKKTQALTVEVNITLAVADNSYAPTMATGTEILAVESLRRPTSQTRVTPEYLVARSVDHITAQTTATGTPTIYAVTDDSTVEIVLYPTPTAIETLTAKVVFMPTKAAATLDDRLANIYLEAVTEYAKYWLQSQPDKPWSNPDAAMASNRQFESFASAAIIRRNQTRTNTSTHVQMRPFA